VGKGKGTAQCVLAEVRRRQGLPSPIGKDLNDRGKKKGVFFTWKKKGSRGLHKQKRRGRRRYLRGKKTDRNPRPQAMGQQGKERKSDVQ